MKIITNELPLPFDVDDTLVMHSVPPYMDDLHEDIVYVRDPLNDKREIRLRKNLPMIRLLMEEQSRGGYIIVWSKGGHKWATHVVKALGLAPYVDVVMTKPRAYCDDKDVSSWLKERIYIEPDIPYKNNSFERS